MLAEKRAKGPAPKRATKKAAAKKAPAKVTARRPRARRRRRPPRRPRPPRRRRLPRRRRRRRRPRRRRRRRARPLRESGPRRPGRYGAEHLFGVVVGEEPSRVELVPQRDEVAEPRVHRGQGLGVAVVHLAPVRPPAERLRLRLEPAEVVLVGRPDVLVDRDVRGVAAVPVRQPDVVGRGEPHLDREDHLERQAGDRPGAAPRRPPAGARGAARTPSRRSGPAAGVQNTSCGRGRVGAGRERAGGDAADRRHQPAARPGRAGRPRRRPCWTGTRRRASAASRAGAGRRPARGCCA